jgi:hypothetical protein
MTEEDVKKLLNETRGQMTKALEHFEYELSKIRAAPVPACWMVLRWMLTEPKRRFTR